jgi:hypothetical protein
VIRLNVAVTTPLWRSFLPDVTGTKQVGVELIQLNADLSVASVLQRVKEIHLLLALDANQHRASVCFERGPVRGEICEAIYRNGFDFLLEVEAADREVN